MERAKNVVDYVRAQFRDIDYENMTLKQLKEEAQTYARMTGMNEEEASRHAKSMIETWHEVHGNNKGRKAGGSSEKPE
jgi:uncharacterized heparinase superfamily protein